jgi:hypothetical protein
VGGVGSSPAASDGGPSAPFTGPLTADPSRWGRPWQAAGATEAAEDLTTWRARCHLATAIVDPLTGAGGPGT